MLDFIAVIPIPVHSHGGGGSFVWAKILILAIVSFIFVVLPFLIYIIKEYIKHKKKYPTISFDLANYPLSSVIFEVYIVVTGVGFIGWITNFIYKLMF
jgi:hypothetical protein